MLVRYWRHDRIREARTGRVIVDDARGLLVWIPDGAPMMRAQTVAGERPRRLADQVAAEWRAAPATWRGPGVLMFFPAGGRRGRHHRPRARHLAEPGGAWRWKDEDEFAERTGHEWYWDAEQAAEIRAEGERVVKLIEAAEFPFDGSWCDFTPDPSWPLPHLPPAWDRPRA